MYNRYIPQADGSYTRNRMPEQNTPKQTFKPLQQEPPPVPECAELPQNKGSVPHPSGGFLKNLLPKGFDTGDLIIILLLLLMAGDNEKDRSNAILTIALYFLM